jgi:hypothetical protein
MSRFTKTLALVLAVVAPAVARAGTAEDIAEARLFLKSAQDEQAVIVLSRAVDRGDASRPQKIEIFLLLGMARFNVQDEEGARLAFKRALETDADAQLPKLAPPKTRKLFDEVRAALEKERLAAPVVAPARAAPPPPPKPEETPVVSAKPGLGGRRIAGVVVGALGLAAAGTGIWVAHSGVAMRNDANAQPEAAQAESTYQQAKTRYAVGWAVIGVGAAAAVAGLVVAVIPSAEAPATVSLTPQGVVLAGRFP